MVVKFNRIFDTEEEDILTEILPSSSIYYNQYKIMVVVNHAGNIHMRAIYSDSLECNLISIIGIPSNSILPLIISESLLFRYSQIDGIMDITLSHLNHINGVLNEDIKTFLTAEYLKATYGF